MFLKKMIWGNKSGCEVKMPINFNKQRNKNYLEVLTIVNNC